MPATLAPPEEVRIRTEPKRETFLHRLRRTLLRFILLLAISSFVAGGLYLAKKGFGREWRARVVEELHKRGVEVSVRRLTLDPFRGLVAQDVRIYDYKQRENTLAVISEIALEINYSALFHHQPFLNALEIRDANVSFPAVDPQLPRAELKNFRAHVFFPPEQIVVNQAEASFGGVRISATGQVIRRDGPPDDTPDAEWSRRMRWLQQIAAEVARFRFPGAAPRLQLKFTGDSSAPQLAHVEATFRGDQIARGEYLMRDVAVAAEWSGNALAITQAQWRDAVGDFSGRGNWNAPRDQADFQARSTIDLKAFSALLGFESYLADVIFTAAPRVEISGAGSLGEAAPHLQVLGRVGAERFTFKGVPFQTFGTDFSWTSDRLMLRDIRLQHASGTLTGDLFEAPDDFRLNLDSGISPSALAPVAPPELRAFLAEWEWRKAPDIRLSVRGKNRNPATWKGDGRVTLDQTRFRGVWMKSASAQLHLGDGTIRFENFRVVRDEGIGTGTAAYDFRNYELRLTNVETYLNPAEAIYWIEPRFWKFVVPYKFHAPPHVIANGIVQFHGGKNTHLELVADAPTGMDYVFVGKTLPFEHISGHLLFTEDRLQLGDVHGRLFSGEMRGEADISLARGDHHYTAKLAATDVDFPLLTALYFKYETSHGLLSGTYDFAGRGDDARIMRGEGKIEVTNGEVFAIPIFGPLSDLLGKILPGAGYSIARKATSSFTIQEGVFHTNDFRVAGKLFAMVGHGDIHFLDDKLDFDVRIQPNGAGLLLSPMYKLFEYRGEGSLKKPVWRPKRF